LDETHETWFEKQKFPDLQDSYDVRMMQNRKYVTVNWIRIIPLSFGGYGIFGPHNGNRVLPDMGKQLKDAAIQLEI
jgi:hypothetical protein